MNENPEPKIVVDEDWKSQVQAEKEKLAANSAGESSGPAETAPAGAENRPEPEPASATAGQQPQMPAPTMSLLFSSLATQAMFALGMISDPQSGQPSVSLDEARHVIDTLQLLEQKTQGNLTASERELLTRVLYDLRMAFVAVRDSKAG